MLRHVPQMTLLSALVAGVLLGSPVAREILPSSAPRGARILVVGEGLDVPSLAIAFPSSSGGSVAAAIIVRSSKFVEAVVPPFAANGVVTVSAHTTSIGAFPFTVLNDPPFVKSATIAASAQAHDLFNQPSGAATVTATGATWVSDRLHHQIRKISATGALLSVIGSGNPGMADGAASQALFKRPTGLAFDQGHAVLYVADSGNNVIRRIAADGSVSTLAGSGRPEFADGIGAQASFNDPNCVAADANGNVYVADSGNNRIRLITPGGVVTTLAGDVHEGFADGTASQALFKQPAAVAVDADGVVYIADAGNNRIRKLERGTVTTLAGTGHGALVDGPALSAEFKQPMGIALDDAGNVLVADTLNHAIRKITIAAPGTPVSTIAGNGSLGDVDGDPAASRFKQPMGIDLHGALMIADSMNDALRVLFGQPVFSDLYPRKGNPRGGTEVRIFGSGFVPGMTQVMFGTTAAASSTYVASTELLVTTPAAPIGTVDVTVGTPAGSVTLKNAFRFEPPFVAIVISPAGATIEPGKDLQFTALGVATDNSTTDITTQVMWASSAPAVATISATGLAHAFAAGTATITATFDNLVHSTPLTVAVPEPVPPDPATVASKLDPTVVGMFVDEIRFLYSGPNAIQTGVAPGAIDDDRAAVIRGRALTIGGQPLPAVHVTAVGHPELGQTLTRADGLFDFVINGGGTLTLRFAKQNFIPLQRSVTTVWGQQTTIDDVVLIGYDSQVTAINLGASAEQIARGSAVTDSDGTRQATLVVPSGVTAVLSFPDGTTQPAQTLHVRATEFSVGPNGPKAMPAILPLHSAYTYCVELSADEATAAGAEVRFSKPLVLYVENFLGFPVGTVVPTGFYDRQRALWMPSDNGIVLKIVSITNGAADLDLNGDGVPDDPTPIGIDASERQTVAMSYVVGQTLWRVPVSHFSPWDCNWPYVPPSDAVAPSQPQPSFAPPPSNNDGSGSTCHASIVNCYSATVFESVPITGTPFSLEYNSSRIAQTQNGMTIALTGATLPASLKRVDLTIGIAGRSLQVSFPPQPNLTYDFAWDGIDVYGRQIQGTRDASVTIAYAYDLLYARPGTGQFVRAWATFSSMPMLGIRGRTEIQFTQSLTLRLGHFGMESTGFGGWTFSSQQQYDGRGGTIYDAGGAQRSGDAAQTNQLALTTYAGNTQFGFSGDGGPATAAALLASNFIAVGPDGSLYISDSCGGGCKRIRRVDAQSGIINTIAGNGIAGFTADGALALGSSISASQLAVGPDGTVYFGDGFRVRRIVDGILTTVAGSGASGDGSLPPDGASATQVAIVPRALAVGFDGTIYIAVSQGILRVTPDGRISTYSLLRFASGLAAGPGGELFAADTFFVYEFDAKGGRVIAGPISSNRDLPDGESATSGSLSRPTMVAVASDGTVLVSETGLAPRIRAIGTDGIATALIGTGTFPNWRDGLPPDGLLARAAPIGPWGVAVGPDGSVFVLDQQLSLVRRAAGVFPPLRRGPTAVPSPDGSAAYIIENGRHTSTVDTLTGVTLLTLGCDTNGYLTSVTDLDGNVTTIDRAADGSPTAIVAPGGQRTTLQTTAGRLAQVADPANESYKLAYDTNGLLTDLTDPRKGLHHITYDRRGLVTRDDGPDGSYFTLSRTGMGQNYTSTRTTAEGHGHVYKVQLAADTAATREHDAPDGTSVKFTFAAAATTATSSDGGSQTTIDAPDPRFGMTAPLLGSGTFSGGSKTAAISFTRAVTSDPATPFALASLSETLTLNGQRWTNSYDGSSRTTLTTTPAGRTVRSTLNAKGRLASLSQPGIAPLGFGYSSFGQLASIQDGTRSIAFGYDAKQQLTSITDALQRTVQFSYDDAGRVTAQTLPDLRVIRFGYDAAGNVTSVTPPSRPDHLFTFTPADLMSSYTPPSSAATQYSYNLDRQLTAIIRPDGSSIGVSYDTFGRPAGVSIGRGKYAYGYDAASGQLRSVAAPDGTVLAYGYSGPLLSSVSWSGTVGGAVSFGYDNNFRLTSETAAASAVSFGYDPDGLLISAGALSLTRDPQNGLLTGSTLGAVTDAWTYNVFAELLSYTATAASVPVLGEQFTRNDAGQIVQKSESILSETHTYGYSYDTAGRLTSVTKDGASLSSYTYDANSNRLPGTYDAQDRMLAYGGASYTYTAAGELTSKTDSSGTTSYTYDELGNLTHLALPTGEVIDYVIDGQNRRVGKKVNGVLVRQWLYEDTLRIVAELDGSGTLLSRFVYGSRANVPDFMIRGGITYRIISDHLGSPRLIVDSLAGAVVQRMDYDEFGNVVVDTNQGFTPFGFAGGLFDGDTNLVRFGARDYDPRAGRWTAKDPIGFFGSDSNLYGYVLNDPINAADPDGTVIIMQRHRVFARSPHHKSIRIIPRNQQRYRNDPRFRRGAGGRYFCTIGAGPNLRGSLVSDLNRESDASPENTPIGIVRPPYGISEDDFIDALLAADAAYGDRLRYALFPSIAYPGDFYNSNSYIDGLIRSTGASPPASGPYFGDWTPVPPSAFHP